MSLTMAYISLINFSAAPVEIRDSQPQQNWAVEVGNRLIAEQLGYDTAEQTHLAMNRFQS